MTEVPTPWPELAIVLEGDPDPLLFGEEELSLAAAYRLEKRRNEWLRGREAAKRLALRLGLCVEARACSVSRPHLVFHGRPSDWFVSLSHSEGWAGAAVASEPVGIDVQALRPFPLGAAHLFLSEMEELEMRNCLSADSLLHFWCAKEAAFKRHHPQYATLRQVPLRLVRARSDALLFDDAETVRLDGIIVAISPPAVGRTGT